jgi:hypothetical protein
MALLQNIQSRMIQLAHVFDATNAGQGAILNHSNVPMCFFCGVTEPETLDIGVLRILQRSPDYSFSLEWFDYITESAEERFFTNHKQTSFPHLWKYADNHYAICMTCVRCLTVLKECERKVCHWHPGHLLTLIENAPAFSLQGTLELFLPADVSSLVEDYRLDIALGIGWEVI